MQEREKKKYMGIDEFFMRRCLQLAANGICYARPNPMVGAVIVAPLTPHPGTLTSNPGTLTSNLSPLTTRIIGEGYHVRFGEGHAEVNAFASVRAEDEAL